jgi:hypothetical protein
LKPPASNLVLLPQPVAQQGMRVSQGLMHRGLATHCACVHDAAGGGSPSTEALGSAARGSSPAVGLITCMAASVLNTARQRSLSRDSAVCQ